MSNKDKVVSLPEIAGLSKAQVGLIISLFAQFEGRIRIVKEEFKRLTKRKISDDVLNQIRSKYEKEIKALEQSLAKDGKLNPLSSYAFRDKALWLVFQDAMEWRPRKWERISRDESEEREGYDSKTMIECIDLAHKMDMDIRKHELDIWKAHHNAGAGGGTGGTVGDDEDEDESKLEATNDGVAW